MAKKTADSNPKPTSPDFNLEVRVNAFGQLEYNVPINQITEHVNATTNDKKLQKPATNEGETPAENAQEEE